MSTRAAWSVLRAACGQWLALDEAGRRAFEHRTVERDLDDLLAEQGHHRGPQPERAVTTPWRGRWDEVSRHVSNVEVTGSPYMAAVGVLQVVADEPVHIALSIAAHTDELTDLARRWRASPADRGEVDRTLLDLLGSYRPTDVPPWLDEEACEAVVSTLRRAGCGGEVRALSPSRGDELVVVLPHALAELDIDALEREIGMLAGRRARLLVSDDHPAVRLG